uniref:Uncharacterized protein n=1 Tax=Rhizophagus irregularis (strain DAOM 181602 / DAOM 197198 / MUCL 43194) TaxID=747089 RepID=U9T0X0_RHIID
MPIYMFNEPNINNLRMFDLIGRKILNMMFFLGNYIMDQRLNWLFRRPIFKSEKLIYISHPSHTSPSTLILDGGEHKVQRKTQALLHLLQLMLLNADTDSVNDQSSKGMLQLLHACIKSASLVLTA